jgi:hypothetical protein
MFLFILQYESATTALVAEDTTVASDSLNGAGLAETAVEDGGVDWGQVSLYSLSTVGVWLVDGMVSWAVQRTGQHLLRRELEGQAGFWTRLALKALYSCPRWAFTAREIRQSEETLHQVKVFCESMEETDRTYQQRVRERTEAAEEVFEPRVTSTEKKKVK